MLLRSLVVWSWQGAGRGENELINLLKPKIRSEIYRKLYFSQKIEGLFSGHFAVMDRIIVFPYSLSSWRLQIMLEELGLSCNVEKVDMFQWEHLQPSHLRLSPSVRSLLRYSHLTAPPLSRRPSQSWSLRRAGRSLVRTFFIFSSPPHHHRRLPSPLMSASSVRSWRRSILESSLTASPSTLSRPSS